MVSREDIKTVCSVQNLIEHCIQLDMDRTDTMRVLHEKAKIDPGFTELVWMRLEDENREFFEAYQLRLALKHQIVRFNDLLKIQAELMSHVQSSESSNSPATNGSAMTVIQQNSECYAAEHTGAPIKRESLHSAMTAGLSGAFNNGVAQYGNIHPAYELSSMSERVDSLSTALLNQNTDMTMMQRINGAMIKPDSYSSNPQFMLSADGNVLENRTNMRDPCFSSLGPNTLPLNEPFLEMDMTSMLGQLPRNFSLTDFTAADYSRFDSTMNYHRTDSDNIVNSHGRGELQEENKTLDSSYEDFTSD